MKQKNETKTLTLKLLQWTAKLKISFETLITDDDSINNNK